MAFADGDGRMRRIVLIAVSICGVIGAAAMMGMHSLAILGTDPSIQQATEIKEELTVPFLVEDTGLIVEQLVLYEGPFWEDGSDSEPTCTIALLLHNSNRQGIEHAKVVLSTPSGDLVFEADMIPAGMSVLVPEQNEAKFTQESILNCNCWIEFGQGEWGSEGVLQIRQTGMGTIALTNLTDKVLTNVHLYYKSYLSDPGILIGGKSFVYTLPCINPGQIIHICPKNYAKGYTEFVRIQWQIS